MTVPARTDQRSPRPGAPRSAPRPRRHRHAVPARRRQLAGCGCPGKASPGVRSPHMDLPRRGRNRTCPATPQAASSGPSLVLARPPPPIREPSSRTFQPRMRGQAIPLPWPDFGSILDRFLVFWNKVLEFGRFRPPTATQLPLHDDRSRAGDRGPIQSAVLNTISQKPGSATTKCETATPDKSSVQS